MSRVFEALTRARDEKQVQVQQPVEKVESTVTVEMLVEENGSTREQFSKANGLVSKTNGIAHATQELYPVITKGEKSWRDKIEGWLLGWDLQRYNSYPIVALEKESPGSEQYKILREQIKRLRAESGIRNFSITSPVKRDGKTTVAVNVAATLSLDYEEQVLLIDGDLRAPAIHHYFNAVQSPGLSDYLGSDSKLNLKSLVQETFLPGLRILP